MLLAKKERVLLWGMINRLTEICYGMEMNVEKTKVMRISRQESPVEIMIHQKTVETLEYFTYLGSMIIKRCKMYV